MEEIIDIHLRGNLFWHYGEEHRNEDYDVYVSDLIGDEYWNYAYLKKSDVNLKENFEEIKKVMEKLQRKPIVYITSKLLNDQLEKALRNANLKLLYTDVWMTRKKLEEFKMPKSEVDFTVCEVEKEWKKEFVRAVLDGFAGDDPEDPYGNLEDGYRIALEGTFEKKESEYPVVHFGAKKEQEIIGTATAVYKGKKAIIYNVTTNKKYQKKGVCKQLMESVIQKLRGYGVDEVCVQTEQGFYPEQVYKKMGFEERMLGKAYGEEE